MQKGLILLVLLACSAVIKGRPVELLEEEVGQKIFHEDPNYLIYVSTAEGKPPQEFQTYCEQADHGCAYITPEVTEFDTFFKFMGVPNHNYYIIVDASHRRKYLLEKHPTAENFKKFFEEFKEGKAQAYYASDPIPELQEGPVRELVGKTIMQFVNVPGRTTAVFLYAEASFCQECIDLLEDFQKLAEKLASPKFVFGRMNLVTNDHPEIEQENVPSVLVFLPDRSLQVIERFDAQELQYKLTHLPQTEVESSTKAQTSASEL